MPISIDYDSSIDAIVMKCTGSISYDALPVLATELLSHPKFRENIRQLVDSTEAVLNLSATDLQLVARDFESIGDLLGHKRQLALVVSRDVDYGKMRQYEVYFQGGPGVEVRAFRSLDKAHQWLSSSS